MGSELAIAPGAVVVVSGCVNLGSGANVSCKVPPVQPLESSAAIAKQVSNDFKC